MPLVRIDDLPSHARLWTFAASRPLTTAEEQRLLETVDSFLADWAAHGVPLTCARQWRAEQFLFVAVEEEAAGVSGCSIDALIRSLKTLEREFELSLTDNGPVFYRDGTTIRRVSRVEFKNLAEVGSVGTDTVVYDNTIQTLGALRDGRWELPAGQSWHGDAFLREIGA